MRLLIEEYQYKVEDLPNSNDLKVILNELGGFEDIEGKISINYVGYYYSNQLHDCVFILPKVLITVDEDGSEKAFGEYKPEEIVNVDKSNLDDIKKRFLYNFAVWIYRAINVFRESDRGKDSGIIFYKHIAQVGHGRRVIANTLLDLILSLIQFNKDNQNFFFFVLKNIHSGYNKINWTRTISHCQAFVQDETPMYLNLVNKKRKINFDEELLIIFFSILNYIDETYGFKEKINVNFPLIKGKKFETYLNGFGVTRLHQIKYKYFSDKALYLWDLCYEFFKRSYQTKISSQMKEYLLVKDFNIVFEAIIDELIGDKLPKKYQPMKEQKDGKLVDHMYSWYDLTHTNENEKIFYIGDSKYYKRQNKISQESWYKQFTYARNVIQWNLDLFLDGNNDKEDKKVRDDVTEGYNIIPNFFISAIMDKNLSYKSDIFRTEKDKKFDLSRQYENRLFDRDTLLVCHYDVNFLFIVSLYGRNDSSQKGEWKKKVRNIFRKEIRAILNEVFEFSAMTAHEDVDAHNYINDNFQLLLGKVYKPFADVDGQEFYSLALRKPESIKIKDYSRRAEVMERIVRENESLKAILSNYFYIAPCPLGTDPTSLKELPKVKHVDNVGVPAEFRTIYHFEAYRNDIFLIGCYKNAAHLSWIFGRKGKKDNMYNVRIGKDRKGGVSKSAARNKAPKFVFIYDFNHPKADDSFQFRVHNAAYTPYDFMKKTNYPEPHGDYLSWVLEDDPITFGWVDIPSIIRDYKSSHSDYSGEPIYLTGEEMLKYRVR